MTASIRCPICREPVDPQTSPAPPFCSERCRQLDLGRWLDERYSVPIERIDEDEDYGEGRADDLAHRN